MSPIPDDDFSVAPRRSALSPLHEDDDHRAGLPRRSAISPVPEDEEETVQLPLPRRSTEYGTGGGFAVQFPLPTPEVAPRVLTAPVQLALPDLEPGHGILVQASADLAEAVAGPDLVEAPAAPDLVQLAGGPDIDEGVAEADLDVPSIAAPAPSVQTQLTPAPTPTWQPSIPSPEVAETPDVVESGAEPALEPEPVAPAALAEAPAAEQLPALPAPDIAAAESSSSIWHAPAPWPLDPDDTHALFRRPAPGEPETQWDLTPISAASPDEVVPPEQETTITAPTRRPGQASRRGAKAVRARGSRRHVPWRDHKRLFTVLSIVVGLLLLVGGGGYLFSRFDPTLGGIAQGKLSLPLTAGEYTRDPAQGVSPSTHPDSKISTVSATYSRGGVQQFVVIAYRPQTNPEAALQEIQARNVTRVTGGACGRTTDQNLACVVISGTTAILAVTLVDQTADDLIASAQSVADGLGKD